MAIIPGVYQAKNAISDNSQQGSKFNSIVNAIVNPANTSLLTGFDPVIEEINNPNVGTVVTYTPHTVSGTPPLSLPNSAGQPLESWSVDLLPYQEGTGDPAPDNVRPIHGTDKVTITTAGKNMCDTSGIKENKAISAGSTIGAYPQLADSVKSDVYSNVAYVNAGQTYVLSWANDSYLSANVRLGVICDASEKVIENNITTWKYDNKYVIITPNTTGNLWICVDKESSNYQLEFGSTATPYTPYIAPSQTVITLPQTVYTGTIGSDGGESRSGEVNLGTLNWATANDVGRTYATMAIDNFAVPTTTAERAQGFMCEQYKPSSSLGYNDSMDNCSILRNTNTNNPLYLLNSAFAGYSGEQIKTALTGVKFIYELATPPTFAVPSPAILTPTGTATTRATAEDGTMESMEVTYLGTV